MKAVNTALLWLALPCLGFSFVVPSSPLSGASAQMSLHAVMDHNPELDSMTGAFIETGKRVWDPWGLSNYVPPAYAREAELANGRSAMLATVGWVWPKWFGMFAATDVTSTDPIE